MGGKVVDQFVGIPKPEKLQDFFNKAVIMDQIANDENVQNTLMEKAEELLKGEDMKTAFEVFIDLYQYDALREKFEPTLITGLTYCLTFLHKDYVRATEMIDMITEDQQQTLNDFYKDIFAKTKAELATKQGSEAAAEVGEATTLEAEIPA